MRCRGSTVKDVYRKTMGDAPLAYVETVGGVRVSEDDQIVAGKNDVRLHSNRSPLRATLKYTVDSFIQGWTGMKFLPCCKLQRNFSFTSRSGR